MSFFDGLGSFSRAAPLYFFDIVFEGRRSDHFPFIARDSGGRELGGTWTPPFSAEEQQELIDSPFLWGPTVRTPVRLAPIFRDIAGTNELDEAPRSQADLGRRLYDSLFEGKIGDRFRLDQERHPGELVLRLTFDPDESDKLELYALPWELLHDEDDYLSLTDRPIVRRLRADRRVAEEPLVASRLKVLALPLADDGLDLEKEVEHLKSVGSSEESKVFDLEICDRRMSLADFRRRVERSKAQVLHLMGHGRWSVESRAWGVDFDDRFVSAEELAAAIHSKLEAVRLVVLNTCHSARALEPGTLTANKGLAAALVSSGAVAVLANRAPIGDAAALTLSRLFYSRIANGMSLPRALVRTRWDLADSHRVGHDILPGEWATPVLHLRTRGRVLVIEQRLGLSPGTAGALLLGSAGSVGLLATGGVYVAHRPAALGAAVAAIAAAGRLAWNGLRYRAAEKHVVTWLIERLNAHPRRVRRVAALLVGLGFVLWAFVGRPRVDALPCLERAPHLGDWIDRGVVLSFGESEGWEGAWRRSLEGAMTSAGLALIPPDSPDAELLAEACVAWSVVGVHAPNAAGGATQVRIRHRGREVVAFSVAGPLQDVQPAIRREVMKSVTGEAPPGPVLGEKSISRNQQALELYADGDLGGAEAVLKRAIAEDMDSSLLRNNYAQVLVDRARTQRLLALYGSESRSAARAGVDGRALLLEALGELDYAVALDPSSPWSRHNRGQLWRELAELGGEGDALGKAEADFRAALALMPSFAESASDLAALLLDRGRPRDVAEAMRWLKRARGVVSRRDRSTRASIAKNLGRAYALAHRPDRALEAFEEAECLAPIDRWGLRAEVLGRQAVLVEKALGPATADVAWRRYDLFSRPREKDPLRPLYEDWRRRFPDPGGTARFGMWSRRCSSGQLAARKAIRAAAAEGGEPSAISISAIAEQFTDAPGLRGGRG